jgi:cytochrome P450 family 4
LVFLVDPRDIELVLSSQVYLDKSPEYRFFEPWLGNGLLISSGKCYVNNSNFSKKKTHISKRIESETFLNIS